MNLLKYLLYITFVFFLLSCLHLSNKKIYIENECKNFFPKKDYNDYIIGEDKKKLEEITDINEYIDILYKLIKKKTIPTTKYFSHYNESAYDFGTVYKKLINYYHEDNNDKNIILKIIIEINNKPDADYISGYTRGLFKTYYILLEKMN